jgi:AcrR family transcriptional regulator
MSRWEPDARGRLAEAALELYRERGYDQVTVAEIAKRAGLTERTFFRHYADKREVLFYGATVLQDAFVRGIDEAPAELAPIDVVGTALEVATAMFGSDNAVAAQRQAIVHANPELRERELNKLAALAGAATESLRRRGIAEPAASLAAEAGIAVFKVAFQLWTDGASGRPLSQVIRESLADLKSVTSGT